MQAARTWFYTRGARVCEDPPPQELPKGRHRKPRRARRVHVRLRRWRAGSTRVMRLPLFGQGVSTATNEKSRKRNLAFSGEGRGFRGRGRLHRRGRAQAPSEKIVVPLPMARNGPKVRPKLEDDGTSSRALPRL